MNQPNTNHVMEAQKIRQQILDKLPSEIPDGDAQISEREKSAYVTMFEKQTQKIKSILDDQLAELSDKMDGKYKETLEKHKQTLQKDYQAMISKLNELRTAGDSAWADVRQGTRKAYNDLTQGIRSALTRFQ